MSQQKPLQYVVQDLQPEYITSEDDFSGPHGSSLDPRFALRPDFIEKTRGVPAMRGHWRCPYCKLNFARKKPCLMHMGLLPNFPAHCKVLLAKDEERRGKMIKPSKPAWFQEYNACRAKSPRTGQGNETVFDVWCECELLEAFCGRRGLFFKRRDRQLGENHKLDADVFSDAEMTHRVFSIEARMRLQPFQITHNTVLETQKVDAMLATGLPCVFLVEWPATGHQCYVEITQELLDRDAKKIPAFKRTMNPRPNQYQDTAMCWDIPNRCFRSIVDV